MKVITKVVDIENQEFALVKGEHNGSTYYGTIPYTEIDEKGNLKRELNGHEMCISLIGIADALENRTKRIALDKYKAEGHSLAEILTFIACGYTTENWDPETFRLAKECAGE